MLLRIVFIDRKVSRSALPAAGIWHRNNIFAYLCRPKIKRATFTLK